MISCFELAAGLTFEESIIQTSTFSSIRISDEGMCELMSVYKCILSPNVVDLDPGTNEVVSDDDDDETEVQLKDTPVSESTPNNTDIQNKVITTRDNGIQEHHVDSFNTQNATSDVTSDKKTFNEKFNLADIPQEIINQILIGKRVTNH